MAPTGPDSRAHPRLALVLQVDYPDREGYLSDATENLSLGGVFVRTERSFAIGEMVALRLSFPGLLDPTVLEGVVVWARAGRDGVPAGVGIKIPEERQADRERLAQLLERRGRGVEMSGRTYRILLVEDNPHIMELYEYVMKKLARNDQVDVEVTVAKDGFDALQRLAREEFSLVVTDLYMPVLDGFEFIRKLRADPRTRDLPVVAISAGGLEAQEGARSAGASVFLRKPVRFTDVLDTVKSLLHI
jgi:uncharacterized protein (TIGR02266 family)